MTNAAARKVPAWPLPNCAAPAMSGSSGNDPIMCNPKSPPRIKLNDGSEVDLPLGTSEVRVQARQCGDYYCCIRGTRHVAATGKTLDDAFLSAVNLAA